MIGKMMTPTTTRAGLPALRIGGRVRRSDDGAKGRVAWANGVSVKIRWDDGGQVAWRRDSLAGRPVEFLRDEDDQAAAPAAPATAPGPARDGSRAAAAGAATPGAPAERPRLCEAPAGPKEKHASAVDAAAKVLAEAGRALSCKEMIAAMAARGYWTSPGGKTPDATLYSALLREIRARGEQTRFRKAERGRFALREGA